MSKISIVAQTFVCARPASQLRLSKWRLVTRMLVLPHGQYPARAIGEPFTVALIRETNFLRISMGRIQTLLNRTNRPEYPPDITLAAPHGRRVAKVERPGGQAPTWRKQKNAAPDDRARSAKLPAVAFAPVPMAFAREVVHGPGVFAT